MRRMFLLAGLVLGLVAFSTAFVSSAKADTVGPINFDPPSYHVGDINGQMGWTKTGPYDVKVAANDHYPAAETYRFGEFALRLSDAVTSGSFSDQTFSPGLLEPAGEGPLRNRFSATFWIGSTQTAVQPGMHMSVSPDNGSGARMSYLRFEDQADGIHVFFDDVINPGPVGTVSTFTDTDVATLSRTRAHSIRFSITFKTGPGNDVVRIYVDGEEVTRGTTWENYYRYDPEAAGNGNQVSPVSKLLFRESGDAHPADLNKGFLVDRLSLESDN
jgi:hypothetical protein